MFKPSANHRAPSLQSGLDASKIRKMIKTRKKQLCNQNVLLKEPMGLWKADPLSRQLFLLTEKRLQYCSCMRLRTGGEQRNRNVTDDNIASRDHEKHNGVGGLCGGDSAVK
jgi:hypothetical protein